MICDNCQITYKTPDSKYDSTRHKHSFCSRKCFKIHRTRHKTVTRPCGFCAREITKPSYTLKNSKSGEIFCNRSCSVSYNNRQKRDSRRSKCEILLYDLLVSEFPFLKILPNDKKQLDGFESDIAIPSLNLSIEWNGPFHYIPIFGQAKLNGIQNRDAIKISIAQRKGINLIVIPDLVSTKQKVLEVFKSLSQKIKRMVEELNP